MPLTTRKYNKNKRSGSKPIQTKRTSKNKKRWIRQVEHANRLLSRANYFKLKGDEIMRNAKYKQCLYSSQIVPIKVYIK